MGRPENWSEQVATDPPTGPSTPSGVSSAYGPPEVVEGELMTFDPRGEVHLEVYVGYWLHIDRLGERDGREIAAEALAAADEAAKHYRPWDWG